MTPAETGRRLAVISVVVLAVVMAIGGGLLLARSILNQVPGENGADLAVADTTQSVTTTAGLATTSTATTTTTTALPTTTTTLMATQTTVFGDLNLAIPMSQPECDGTFITLIGASVEPDNYQSEISQLLNSYPGSVYLRTDTTCLSLRQELDGNPIYAVYYGPFDTFQEACDARSRGPSGSYVKPLDNFSDPEEVPSCG